MWRRFATFGLQKAKYLCPYKSRKVLSQALQFQTLTAQSPVGYVKHRLEPEPRYILQPTKGRSRLPPFFSRVVPIRQSGMRGIGARR